MAKRKRGLKEHITTILRVNDKKEFLKEFNKSVPYKDYLEQCEEIYKKARGETNE